MFDDALADREADPGPRDFAAVQPLEDTEDFLMVIRIDPDAVVLYGKPPHVAVACRAHMNARRLYAAVLDRVSDEVLKYLEDAHGGASNMRQRVRRDLRSALLDRRSQVSESIAEDRLTIGACDRL